MELARLVEPPVLGDAQSSVPGRFVPGVGFTGSPCGYFHDQVEWLALPGDDVAVVLAVEGRVGVDEMSMSARFAGWPASPASGRCIFLPTRWCYPGCPGTGPGGAGCRSRRGVGHWSYRLARAPAGPGGVGASEVSCPCCKSHLRLRRLGVPLLCNKLILFACLGGGPW